LQLSPYKNAQRNLTSKLYPTTRPTRLRKISSPKKLKKDLTENIPGKEPSTDSNSDSDDKEKDFPQSD